MRFLRDVVSWIGLFLLLIASFAYADEIGAVARRVYAVLVPGAAVATGEREVTVARAGGAGFLVAAKINGVAARLVFDTGASQVVLTPQTAAEIGLDVAGLSYTVPVLTANGRTEAAPVMLATLAVGDIVERRVPALVARPGALFENLLGMSFLSRLASYEVRGQRLVLRGRAVAEAPAR